MCDDESPKGPRRSSVLSLHSLKSIIQFIEVVILEGNVGEALKLDRAVIYNNIKKPKIAIFRYAQKYLTDNI